MALFHVARYVGPEAAWPAPAESVGRARALLERLQCRARERQQRQQRQESPPPEAAAQAAEAAAGKRRRRPRRRRRRVSSVGTGTADAPRKKRQRADAEDADAAYSDGTPEESPTEAPVAAEARGGGPPGEASGPPAHALVLGGFGKRKATKAVVIPALLQSAASGFLVGRGGYRPSDLCVSAPTGSGKTLAFVIPVVQALMHRVVCHVRALAVLPTKELAQQVSKVFSVYTDATPLRVALITGQKSLAKEQESLVQKTADGYRCLADIVVATPGRLVDHIDQTPGFSLQQLRFLVIDEADRMIDTMHQAWLPRVVAAAFRSEGPTGPWVPLQRRQPPAVTAASTCCPQMPLQKLLFSATLTQSPEKLQQLGLYQPQLFSWGPAYRDPEGTEGDKAGSTGGKYAFPTGLLHSYVPCSLSSKPLVILHLLAETNFSRVLCFTNSRENSHRLFLLIQAFGGVNVAEFSSRYGPGQRKNILKQFEQGKIQLLVSTDAMARGIDVRGVQLVVNYDAPQYLRTYVHRVGRTARAGRAGQAFTLLLKVQEHKFLRMVTGVGGPQLARHEVPAESLQLLVPRYEEALAQLEKAIKAERKQKAA
ncbi:ATP-dependent RNA helicase DDX51 isoform X2 [Tamandua tetradactyla]|uniref:ATP-dependent RNA helicase DDX51 isoform X2 n=1 Tax=Tamandua tetradactyla TaxID=48850 RepID=UPI0040540E3A